MNRVYDCDSAAAAAEEPAATPAAPAPTATSFSLEGLVSRLPDVLWCPSAAASARPASIGIDLFGACLDAPDELSVHYKAQVQPVLQLQQTHQQPQQGMQKQKVQHMLLRLRGCVTRQQSLGRRLCFFDLQKEETAAAAAEVAATRESSGGDTAVAASDEPAKAQPRGGSPSAAAIEASSDAAGAAANTEAAAEAANCDVGAAAATCVAVCCSVSSSDFGGLDVHRSVSRKIRIGDFVEALGVLETRVTSNEIKRIRHKLGGPLTSRAPVTVLNEVTRVIGLKVLAIRAYRPAAGAAAAAVATAAAAAAEKLQQCCLLMGKPQTAAPTSTPVTSTATGAAAAADLSKVCKFYLVAGTCRRLSCPLLHVRDGRLRRHYDLIKAQRQVLRVKQQLLLAPTSQKQQQLQQQHLQQLLLPQPDRQRLHQKENSPAPPGASFSVMTLQVDPFSFMAPPQQQQQQRQPPRVYPRSLRGPMFADWLVATYGVDRLRQGSGVVEVAGGRGELAFELAVKHNIPCCIIDPRCTYTPKSLALQPPGSHVAWGGLAPDGPQGGATTGLPRPQQRSSAMNSGSKRALECPLRLTRRQADWLLKHKGLRRREAEEYFREAVETIPALFDFDLIQRSNYVRDKLLTASALVGLHPDEATGPIVQVGLHILALRRAQTLSSGICAADLQQQQQQEGAAESLPNLGLAVVPCCVFSEKFPERRVPLRAAEAALASPCAAAKAAAEVPSSTAAAETVSTSAAAPFPPAADSPWASWASLQQHGGDTPEAGSSFMAVAEADGQVLVRTYEELLLWLHLQDPQRRMQQHSLPIVGKNQVIFLPP